MTSNDIFMCALSIAMSGMTVYLFISLFPFAHRRQHDWERMLKSATVTIAPMSRLSRAVAVLMCGMLAAQGFAGALHFTLSSVTGIGSSVLFVITFLLLPSLVLLLRARVTKRVANHNEVA